METRLPVFPSSSGLFSAPTGLEHAARPTPATPSAPGAAITLRRGRPDDAVRCGTICYTAFATIADHHRFARDFPSATAAIEMMTHLLAHPGTYAVVAEIDGRIVGSNFITETDAIGGVGPITVDPGVQNGQIGRRLMVDVLERAEERGLAGVRLVQAAYHNRSLSLYAKLGFDVREPLSVMQGAPLGEVPGGLHVRPATEADLQACGALCRRIHGYDRNGELFGAVRQGTASVVEQDGQITGYTTGVAFFGHTVGESNEDLKALIGAATSFEGPGFLLPTRNAELFRWCLERGLRVVFPATLMSMGPYRDPAGASLPSILY